MNSVHRLFIGSLSLWIMRGFKFGENHLGRRRLFDTCMVCSKASFAKTVFLYNFESIL